MPRGLVSLSESQLRSALLVAQSLAEESRDCRSFVQGSLVKLTRVVASDLTTLSLCDLSQGTRQIFGRPGESLTDDDRLAFNRHFREHPLVRYHASHPNGTTQRISDCLSPGLFENSVLFDDYYRRIKIHHVMALPLRIDHGTVISVVFNRQSKDFSDNERSLLDAVRPLLGALYRNLVIREEADLDLADMGKLAAEAGWFAMRIAGGIRIVDAPPAARRLLTRFFPEVAVSDCAVLPRALTEWVSRSRHWGLERPAVNFGNQFTTAQLGMRLTVHFITGGTTLGTGTLLLRAARSEFNANRLGEVPTKVDLTRREREVLEFVVAGKTNSDIALLLSISVRTVQKHLERVFDKLGVETRTAAAMSAVRTMGPTDCERAV